MRSWNSVPHHAEIPGTPIPKAPKGPRARWMRKSKGTESAMERRRREQHDDHVRQQREDLGRRRGRYKSDGTPDPDGKYDERGRRRYA